MPNPRRRDEFKDVGELLDEGSFLELNRDVERYTETARRRLEEDGWG